MSTEYLRAWDIFKVLERKSFIFQLKPWWFNPDLVRLLPFQRGKMDVYREPVFCFLVTLTAIYPLNDIVKNTVLQVWYYVGLEIYLHRLIKSECQKIVCQSQLEMSFKGFLNLLGWWELYISLSQVDLLHGSFWYHGWIAAVRLIVCCQKGSSITCS